MMPKRFLTLTVILYISCLPAFSQYSRCGTNSLDFRKLLSEQHLKKQANLSGFTAGIDTLYIPVVVHILYNTPEQNISDNQVKSQIDVLNEDYSGKNGTAAQIPDAWKAFLTDSRIRFVLAARTPGLNPVNSTGITRTWVQVTGFEYNDGAIKSTADGGVDPWPTDQYLNIWVCNINNNVLGFAPFPGGNPQYDGVVINYRAFGRIGDLASKYNYGRTATHEVGHWLNLIHIWGDTPDCDLDDQVEDTPLQADANYCCPKFPVYDDCQTSGNGVMFMNYMDYTDDRFMQFFTPEQIMRMDTAINNYRNTLFTSQGHEPASNVLHDVSLEEVMLPLLESGSRCFQPAIKVQNRGSQAVSSLSFIYRMYQGNEQRHTSEVALNAGEQAVISLPAISGKDGLNILEIEVNGSDANAVNNYLSRSYFSPQGSTGCYSGDPWIYPNPVNGTTFCLRSGFAESQDVTIRIVNTLGQNIYEEKRPSNPGDVFTITGFNVSKGVYFIQLIGKEDNSMSSRFVYFPDESGQLSPCE